MEWKRPTVNTGSPVTGKSFYPREEIVARIWEEIENCNHILIAAPRRVGKTSILRYLESHPIAGYNLVFENIQSIQSAEELFKTIYQLIIDSLNKTAKAGHWVKNYLKQIKVTEIGLKEGTVKLDSVELDYLEELNLIIPKLRDSGEKLVLLLDELPEVLHNLHKSNKNEEARVVLKVLRKWRQSEKYSQITFILSGSIGIHHVVKEVEGRISDLNDLKEIGYQPFEKDEAQKYIHWATKGATVQYNHELAAHLIAKIKYCVPYFLNLMLEKIDREADRLNDKNINTEFINDAFMAVVEENRNFGDWKQRLGDYLPIDSFNFVNEVLTHIAHSDSITIQDIYNKAEKYGKQSDYMSLIRDLKNDGYIEGNGQEYVFISPFLKEFWKRDNPVYNG